MNRPDPQLAAFREKVALKYQLYNGLFLGLPFADLEDTGVELPLFANACREKLQAGRSPTEIVEQFLKERKGKLSAEGRIALLFKFLQLVERQVVLFDALEDAAFTEVNDLSGPGSLAHLLSRTAEDSMRTRLAEVLADYRVRIVLTAHPTQFYPDSILGILTDLSEAIAADRLPAIHELLLQMGRTRFQNRQRPTPLEEARSLIWYLEHIFYPTLPALQETLLAALPEPKDPALLAPKVELGFWPGGDRDGNPYVTVDVTARVARELKASLLALYLKDVDALLNRLTFDGVIQPLQVLRDRLHATLRGGPERAAAPGGAAPRAYAAAEELIADLEGIRRELKTRHNGLFLDRLDLFLHKVRGFGFHFASLDLRQDSRIHAQALGEILARLPEGTARYTELTPLQREHLLEALLALPELRAEPRADLDPLAQDALATLAAARDIQAQNGPRGLHRYIISNSQSAANVLEVLVLARLAGWKAGAVDLDVVPLFETVGDLEHAEGIMRRLYALPAYAAHLARRGGTQHIMLGFSDGTKDGGYITANWAIHKAKRDLTRVSREAGVKVVFFDGRGGPPARGGGNTHKFYRSLGADIEHTEIQLTVQGQTISSNFGTPEAARFNVEQLFTAGLEDKLFPPEAPDLTLEDIRLLGKLSAESREAYAGFKADPLFLPYLEEMTPLGYFGMLNIASRPTRRRGPSSLRFEDLRAIPFVGAWSQMKQNIPGFYGVGAALQKLAKGGRKAAANHRRLEDLYKRSLFFRTLLENAMMSLSKSYFPLTRYLEKDRKYGKLWRRIYREATLSKNLLKEITSQQKLMESNPVVRESIRIRERLILPLLVIQQYAMGRVKAIQKNPEAHPKGALDAYTKMVVKAMAANINAARNSA
ncbi:MAG TPA: phosphoenolpyruvate carboxylase [Fibrobacteria bacterium]|nr:phosphoenolpyruvate carboxylase [Fibrobacteria bacterium]